MPASFEILPESRLVHVTYAGQVDADEHRDVLVRVTEDAAFDGDFAVLVDMSAIDGMPNGGELQSLGSLVEAMRDAFRNKIAVVVSGSAQRAFVSLLALYTMTWKVKISAFEDIDEARDWLGATGA